jgi:hypothetical protein
MTGGRYCLRFFLLFGSGALAASAQPFEFAEKLYPVFEKAGCRMCHNPEGVASATRLRFPEEGIFRQQSGIFRSCISKPERQVTSLPTSQLIVAASSSSHCDCGENILERM